MPIAGDYTGVRFNRLTGICFIGRARCGERSHRIWLWQCDCGNQKEIASEKVSNGSTKSCGCLGGKYRGSEATAYSIYREEYGQDGIPFELWREMCQLPCYYCGAIDYNVRKHRTNPSLSFAYHGLDRLDNALGHTLDNCVPCCWRCNETKSTMNHGEFLDFVIQIHNNLELERFRDGYTR